MRKSDHAGCTFCLGTILVWLASLLAGQVAWAQNFCRDFVDNPDPFDCDSVCLTAPWWGPWDCEPTPEGLDCVKAADSWGNVVAERFFDGDVVVRARLSPRGAQPNNLAITAHIDFDSVSGYAGTLLSSGGLELQRWTNVTRDRIASGSLPPDIDLLDPELQLEFELRVVGNVVEFRVWEVDAECPEAPQAFFTDTRYRVGKSSVAFGQARGPVRIVSFCVSELDPEPSLRRGDCNDDGKVNIADAVCVLDRLFGGGAASGCVAATNTNADDAVNLSDATYLLNHLFAGGPAPVAPFPDCGPALPADKELGCVNPPNCEPPQ